MLIILYLHYCGILFPDLRKFCLVLPMAMEMADAIFILFHGHSVSVLPLFALFLPSLLQEMWAACLCNQGVSSCELLPTGP